MSALTWCGPSSRSTSFMAVKIGRSGQPVQKPGGRADTLSASGAAAARTRPDTRVLGLLALGHLVVDMNQGALPPLLPFLKAAFGLSYAASAAILLVASMTSSIETRPERNSTCVECATFGTG